jgi:hypothetical protein
MFITGDALKKEFSEDAYKRAELKELYYKMQVMLITY